MRTPAPVWTGLLALAPLMLATAPVAAGTSVTLALCSQDGSIATVQLPVGREGLPPEHEGPCGGKACHAAGSRKKSATDPNTVLS